METSHTEPYKEQRAEIKALADALLEIESIDSDQAFTNADKRMRRNRQQQRFNNIMRYAAILALPLMLTSVLFGYLYFSEPKGIDEFASVTALPGTVIRYELPDKSVAWLNSGSTLRYPARFRSNKREVELSGEAYFEVTADKKHPFYVNTPSGVTTYVYGTKFNVLAYPTLDFVEVVLEQGRVNVIVPDRDGMAIKPGEQFWYNRNTQECNISNANLKEKVAWKDGKLIFRDATLEYIFYRLERHYNVKIVCENIDRCDSKFRATFTDETLAQVMDYLSQTVPMTWAYDNLQSSETATYKKCIKVNLKLK